MSTDDTQNNKDTINVDQELAENHFRVSIFGSARIKPEDQAYQDVFALAKEIGFHGFDIVTGGGPGIMEAANAGHEAGQKTNGNGSHSIGLTIRLPFENEGNKHLDVKKHFDKFSNRLDTFMALSQAVVVAPGGIGTCLELFYSWQLTQVKHICNIPIIVYGDMWAELIQWVKNYPLKQGYVSPHDMDNVLVAKNHEHVMKKILQLHEIYEKEGEDFCLNFKKYKVD